MRALRLLFRDSAVYGLAGAANRFVKVLLVPVIAKAFPAEVYGAYDSASVAVYALAIAGIMGLHSSVIILATRQPGSGTAPMRGPATTGFRLTLLAASALAGLVLLAPDWWSRLLLGDRSFAGPIAWAAASVPFSSLLIYFLALLQWSFRRRAYVGISLGSAILTIVLSALVAFGTDWGLTGLFAANLAGQAMGAVLGAYACRDLLTGRFSRGLARDMLGIGLPFAVIGVAGTMMPVVDRLFLVQGFSLTDAGLYGLGQKIALLSALVLMGFQAAWGPFAFAHRDDAGMPRLVGRVFLLACTLVAFMALALVLAAPILARLAATSAYGPAAIFVGPLAIATGLNAVFFVVAIGSLLEGRSLHYLSAYLTGLGVIIGLNLLFRLAAMPPLGIAWANCAGQAAAVAVMARLSQRVHPFPYPFAKGAGILLAAATLVAVTGPVAARMPAPGIVAGLMLLTGGFALWCWYGVLGPGERRLFGRMIAGSGAGRSVG